MLNPNNAFKNRNLPRFQRHDLQTGITAGQRKTIRSLMIKNHIWWVTLCRAEFGGMKSMAELTYAEANRCITTAGIWAKSPKGGPYDDKKGKHL